jgi:hypothetical protein
LLVRNHLSDTGAHQPDLLSQFTPIRLSVFLIKNADTAARGCDVTGNTTEQSCFPRTVSSEKHPVLLRLDLPIDVLEDLRFAAVNGKVLAGSAACGSPKAQIQWSLGRSPRNTSKVGPALKARINTSPRPRSIPNISFIELDSMALQDQSKFVFECNLAMMFLLFFNVGRNRGSVRFAH